MIRGCIAAVLLGSTAAIAAPPGTVEQMAWLSGCWTRIGAEAGTGEYWSTPAGGTLLGVGRTVSAGRTTAWEFMRVVEEEGQLVFIALPSGQSEARFRLKSGGSRHVVFESPTHDFPQRVSYELKEDGTLLGRIEGMVGGREQAGNFPYRRMDCE